ncbi:uncharacterized protein LOC109074130 [Cyprinus carpio]|uniref:Uncharacterized protein LOC109074130 n=1 Tax=Cyprinus carpio TaxID=7962 RepID=A0A9R0ANM7_CYPCA|nr:uncharacterized protein LOC109074130 [Cyprinus carpio]
MDVEEQITVNLTILHRVLATVFTDGKETWRKLFTVGSVRELIASAKTELSQRVSLDRILRFDTDFQEFIDTDVNAGVRELDKFQIYYIASNNQDSLEGSVQPLQCHPTDATRTGTTPSLRTLLEEKAPTILREHEETKMLSISSRKFLVKAAVSDLVEKHGFYPSGTEKLALAKEIVSLFPSLRIQVPFGENEGHVRMFLRYKMNYLAMCITCSSILDSSLVLFLHHSCQEIFFDGPSHSGFIEMRLRNIRLNLQQSQRM